MSNNSDDNTVQKVLLPNPAIMADPTDTIVEVKDKYNKLAAQFNSLLSAMRISKLGV